MTSETSHAARKTWWLCLPAVLVTAWCYWPMLGHGLHSDDFWLVATYRDYGVGDFFRFLFTADNGDRPWVYWRPSWVVTFRLMYSAFGTSPEGYQWVSLLLHLGFVTVLFRVAQRISGSAWLGFGAAVLFGVHASHAEAVLWVAASTNVIPAAVLLLMAAERAWRFGTSGRGRDLAIALSMAVASLTWKEAAYGFPIVLASAWLCARERGGWSRRDRSFAAATIGFCGVVLLHYFLLNRIGGVAGDAGAVFAVAASSLAGFVQQLVAVPGEFRVVAAVAVVVVVVLFWLGGARERFWLMATIAGSLPYVVTTSASRFSYFVHGPLCVLLASFAVRWGCRDALRGALGAGALVALLWFDPVGLRQSIGRWGEETQRAERILTALERDGFAERSELWVDTVPPCLMNGLAAAIGLRTGKTPGLRSLQAAPRPPFLIYLDLRADPLPADARLLQLDTQKQEYVEVAFAQMMAALSPVPLFALCDRYRIVDDEATARQMIESRQCDPAREPLLYAEPSVPVERGTEGKVTALRADTRDMGVTVNCAGPMLLVVAFPIPVDFVSAPGAILIDGQPGQVMRANLFFHAVVVPAGEHRIKLVPKFG